MWSSVLNSQLESRRFPHAYLFVGPRGVGKRVAAEEFAGKILGSDAAYKHADYIAFDAAGKGIEDLRALLSRLATKPFVGQYKVAILDNMDQANVQMANALLKTLEEPSPSTILILLSRTANLLPTVVSRCQVLVFSPKAGAVPDNNSPELVSQLEQAMAGEISQRLLLISQLAELESEQISEILLAWLYQQRARLAEQPERGKIMSRILEAMESLRGSFNKKMVLQRLLLS